MAEDHTDPILQEIASKLHLKPYVQVYFFNIALLFLRRHFNLVAIHHNSTIDLQKSTASRPQGRLVDQATNDFLHEWGFHFWSSYVKKRQHLTILSPHGDNAKGKAARRKQYWMELKEWQQGRRAEKPEHTTLKKGLVYFGAGREAIEREVRAYFERMVDIGAVGDDDADEHGWHRDLGPIAGRPSEPAPTKQDEVQPSRPSALSVTPCNDGIQV